MKSTTGWVRTFPRMKAKAGRLGLGILAIPGNVGIQSPRGTRWETCRIPDVTVLTAELWDALQESEAIIRAGKGPALLVVEVVSPSTAQTDYRAKHSEYSVLDIPEYWIVDLEQGVVTVCRLVEGRYEDVEFREAEVIVSSTFSELGLTAAEVLAGGR